MQYLLHKLKYIYVLLIKKSDQVHLFDSKERHENRRAVASRQWTDVIFVGVSAQQRRRNDSANHHHNVGAAVAQTEHADDGCGAFGGGVLLGAVLTSLVGNVSVEKSE